MALLEAFRKYIADNDLATHDDRILLTVSGGVDSMVMLSLFTRSGYRVGVAHCNFQLRGAESDEDEVLVEEETRKYGVEFYNKRFETAAEMERTGESMEMAARRLRYAWFDALSREHGYTVVAIAHHADDSIETFFINLLRGTGLRGLTGISTQVGKVVRPLMFASRKEILEYAVANRIPFREDSSNRSTKYLRNKIRLGLIPRIREINPKFTSLMRRNIARLTDAQLFINHGIERIRGEAVTTENGLDTIHLDRIDPAFPQEFVIYELLNSAYGFKGDVIDSLCHSLRHGMTGRRFYSRERVAYVDRGTIVVAPIAPRRRMSGDRRTGRAAQLLRQFGALFRILRHRRDQELRRAGAHRAGRCRPAEIPAHAAPLARGRLVHSLRHGGPQEGERLPDRRQGLDARKRAAVRTAVGRRDRMARRPPHRRPLPPDARHGKRAAHHQRDCITRPGAAIQPLPPRGWRKRPAPHPARPDQ